jgi:hypothetical protein
MNELLQQTTLADACLAHYRNGMKAMQHDG